VNINDNKEESETFTLFPNPNNGVFKFSSSNKKIVNYKFSCFDLVGKEYPITSKLITDNSTEFELQNCAAGIYFLIVYNQSLSKTFKIIKQ
jgi:hypothetical protein